MRVNVDSVLKPSVDRRRQDDADAAGREPARGRRAVAVVALLAAAALLAAPPPAAAQSEVLPSEEFYPFAKVRELPSQQTISALQDHVGFLWVGTSRGLAQMSGDLVTRVLFQGTEIMALAEVGTDLFVGTLNGLVQLGPLRTGGGESRVHLPTRRVFWAVASGTDTVVFGTDDGVYTLARGGEPTRLGDFVATTAERAPDGTVWLAAIADDGEATELLRLAVGGGKPPEPAGRVEGLVNAIEVWGDKLVLGTDAAVLTAAVPASGPITPTPLVAELGVVNALAVHHDELWIGVEGRGLLRRTADGEEIWYEQHSWDVNSLPNRRVTTLVPLASGDMFIGTFNGSIAYVPTRDAVPRFRASIPNGRSEACLSVYADSAGRLWCTQTGALLQMPDRRGGKVTAYRGIRLGDEVLDPAMPVVLGEIEGRLAVTSDERGFVLFDPKTGAGEDLSDELDVGRVMGMVLVGTTAYLATADGRLVAFDTGTRRVVGDYRAPEATAYVDMIRMGDQLLLARGTDGVQTFSIGGAAFGEVVVPDERVLSMLATGPTLWVGTQQNGVLAVDPKTFAIRKAYGPAEFPGYSTIFDLLPRPDGGAYVVLPKAVAEIDAAGVLTELVGANVFEGIDADHRGSAAKGDALFVGTTSGLLKVTPARLEARAAALAGLTFESFSRQGTENAGLSRPVWEVDQLELGFSENFFAMRVGIPTRPWDVRPIYRYRLEGLHDWRETTSGEIIENAIPDGTYELAVQAYLPGHAPTAPIVMPITVRPPWWRTIWAKLVYGALIASMIGAAFLYQRSRERRMREAQRLDFLEQEIAVTATLQTGFLPRVATAQVPGAALAGYYRPAEECSGDWWWYEAEDPRRLIAAVGDVTGHGVAPAMLAAAIGSTFRTHQAMAMGERLEIVHREVQRIAMGKLLMTFTAVEIDVESGTAHVYNAGGIPVLHAKDGKSRALVSRGNALGGEEFMLGSLEVKLAAGDRLMLTTDGIVEAEISAKRALGLRQISKAFSDMKDAALDTVVPEMLTRLKLDTSTVKQADDWTVVIVERS